MRADISIQMDNEAFTNQGEPSLIAAGAELARILRDLAKHIEAGDTGRGCMDSNGNTVGRFKIVGAKGVSA